MPNLNVHKRYLTELTSTVAAFLTTLDLLMKEPSTAARGGKIALLSNILEMANDRAMHFGLGHSWKKIEGIKKHTLRIE